MQACTNCLLLRKVFQIEHELNNTEFIIFQQVTVFHQKRIKFLQKLSQLG